MEIKASLEKLYHFSCGSCKRWWSIGDYDWKSGEEMTCPFCRETGILPETPLSAKDFSTEVFRVQAIKEQKVSTENELTEAELRLIYLNWLERHRGVEKMLESGDLLPEHTVSSEALLDKLDKLLSLARSSKDTE